MTVRQMIYIVMGVAGSGKTTIGRLLADRLGWQFIEGDDYHPPENVARMASGKPLDDGDRAAWLKSLTAQIRTILAGGENAVLACSALKERYRQLLQVDPDQVRFIYLKGRYEDILTRLEHRHGHYMKPEMLRSQFASLEEPAGALVVDINLPPEKIVQIIMEQING